MKRALLWFAVFLGFMAWMAAHAAAQEPLKIVAPPPEKAPVPEFVIPGQPAELTRPREQDFYPEPIRSRHDPAFIKPFTTVIPTGPKTGVRVGLSGWTAPAGRGETVLRREASGALAFGLSVAWTVTVEEKGPEKKVQPGERPR